MTEYQPIAASEFLTSSNEEIEKLRKTNIWSILRVREIRLKRNRPRINEWAISII